jgi:hypothetical protein
MQKCLKLYVFFIALILSNVVSAQVISAQMDCLDQRKKIFYKVHFHSSFVILDFKGNTNLIPFQSSGVDNKGRRWSRYYNGEFQIDTTLPDPKYVSITVNDSLIASAICK